MIKKRLKRPYSSGTTVNNSANLNVFGKPSEHNKACPSYAMAKTNERKSEVAKLVIPRLYKLITF